MCQFFSLVTDGLGGVFYFNAEQRASLRKNNPKQYEPDSHTSIAHFFGKDEDRLNKYEYNPLTKKFTVDQLNTQDDSKKVKRLCNRLDFVTIVPELIVKPITKPFKKKRLRVTPKDIELLRRWASVWASVGASVWASVWAYVGSFSNLPNWLYVKHKKGEYPYQMLVDLWEKGIVPSFDDNVWRLHGHKGKIIKTITKDELKTIK